MTISNQPSQEIQPLNEEIEIIVHEELRINKQGIVEKYHEGYWVEYETK
jgi:hypothetical protein